MLNQQTIDKLYTMRMRGMAEGFTQQQEDPQTRQLTFEERFALLVDRQWNWRQNRALEKRLKEARLKGSACWEDINWVWLLWNDAPDGRVETPLVLLDVELPIEIEVA